MSRKDGPFRAEVVLPAQFFPSARAQALNQKGECKLLVAVLAEAIDCFQKNLHASDRRGQKLFQEAERWIMSERDNSPFCFEYICAVLGIAPGYLRSGLQRWRRAHPAPADQQPGRQLDPEGSTSPLPQKPSVPRPCDAPTKHVSALAGAPPQP